MIRKPAISSRLIAAVSLVSLSLFAATPALADAIGNFTERLKEQTESSTFPFRVALFAVIAAVAFFGIRSTSQARKLFSLTVVTCATLVLLVALGLHLPQKNIPLIGLGGLVAGCIVGFLLAGKRMLTERKGK